MIKETETELRDEEMALALSTLSLSRTYEEESRVVLMFSSLVCDDPVNSALRFREEGFLAFSKAGDNPQSGSVLHTQYRVTPEVDPNPLSSGSQAQRAEQNLFVLQNLGGIMWDNFQRIQADCVEAQQNPDLVAAM
ncbi:unnamed protein product [Phytophthora fragariaefolia]|uniref:Unnamed protein product n=1 Tax=Phytophthora fragariaefolia TaxID=1490495 RepID=A0A9W7D5Y0_9STRA|nr:unnamed protein product [Phytophthora fragariaefolia]